MWSLRTLKVTPVLAVLGALAAAGCVPAYFEEGNSTRALLLTTINGGSPLSSDVMISTGAVCPDLVELRVQNVPKNPGTVGTPPFTDSIVVERYEVRYSRSDGRGTEGVDVPFRISGGISFEILPGTITNMAVEVVRRQAKIEPPIASLVGGGGGLITTMFAEVILHGRTMHGVVTNAATGRLQIDFANFADNRTDCPVVTSSN